MFCIYITRKASWSVVILTFRMHSTVTQQYSEHRPQASAQPQAPTSAEALTVIAFEKIRWRNFHDFL